MLDVMHPLNLLASKKHWEVVRVGQVGIGQLQQVPGVVQAGPCRHHVHMDASALLRVKEAQCLGQHGTPIPSYNSHVVRDLTDSVSSTCVVASPFQ